MVKRFAYMALGFVATLGLITVAQIVNATDKPYEVFPDRIVFQSPMVDNGHVNIRLTNGQQLNWHMESKCITKTDHECGNIRHHRVGLTLHEEALLIGKTVLPVSVPAGECIEWVQWSETNYHYGEQGEPPVCVTVPPVTTPPVITPPVTTPPTTVPPTTQPPVIEVPEVPEEENPTDTPETPTETPETPPVTEKDTESAPIPPTRVETAVDGESGLDSVSYWVGFASASFAWAVGIPAGILCARAYNRHRDALDEFKPIQHARR